MEKMSKKQKEKREEIVKGMKKGDGKEFEKRYPGRGKEVMYATATKSAMKEHYKNELLSILEYVNINTPSRKIGNEVFKKIGREKLRITDKSFGPVDLPSPKFGPVDLPSPTPKELPQFKPMNPKLRNPGPLEKMIMQYGRNRGGYMKDKPTTDTGYRGAVPMHPKLRNSSSLKDLSKYSIS